MTKIKAFWLGLKERLLEGDSFGRTWTPEEAPDNFDVLNEAYDSGANVADRLTPWRRPD